MVEAHEAENLTASLPAKSSTNYWTVGACVVGGAVIGGAAVFFGGPIVAALIIEKGIELGVGAVICGAVAGGAMGAQAATIAEQMSKGPIDSPGHTVDIHGDVIMEDNTGNVDGDVIMDHGTDVDTGAKNKPIPEPIPIPIPKPKKPDDELNFTVKVTTREGGPFSFSTQTPSAALVNTKFGSPIHATVEPHGLWFFTNVSWQPNGSSIANKTVIQEHGGQFTLTFVLDGQLNPVDRERKFFWHDLSNPSPSLLITVMATNLGKHETKSLSLNFRLEKLTYTLFGLNQPTDIQTFDPTTGIFSIGTGFRQSISMPGPDKLFAIQLVKTVRGASLLENNIPTQVFSAYSGGEFFLDRHTDDTPTMTHSLESFRYRGAPSAIQPQDAYAPSNPFLFADEPQLYFKDPAVSVYSKMTVSMEDDFHLFFICHLSSIILPEAYFPIAAIHWRWKTKIVAEKGVPTPVAQIEKVATLLDQNIPPLCWKACIDKAVTRNDLGTIKSTW
jgi:hypothetical protein